MSFCDVENYKVESGEMEMAVGCIENWGNSSTDSFAGQKTPVKRWFIADAMKLLHSLQKKTSLCLMDTQKVRWKGNLNSMANLVMRNLLGCSCNLYTGFEDQLKTLNVLEIWNYLYN